MSCTPAPSFTPRPAETRWEPLRRFERQTLLEVRIATGAMHQIRAHLHHAGLPLVGDKIYGPDERIFDRFTRRALTEEDHRALRLPRQALHAWRLALPHPRTGEPTAFEAPLPPDLQAFWDACT